VLGGRLRLKQKRKGHRVGHDAILLAAATECARGDRAVELGAGVGAAGLALAVALPDVEVIAGGDRAGAAGHRRGQYCAQRLRTARSCRPPGCHRAADEFAARGIGARIADHVLMNPPFNNPARQNVSPDPVRRAAHAAGDGVLAGWVAAAAWVLHSAGTLTLIWRADGLADVLAALGDHFGRSLRCCRFMAAPDSRQSACWCAPARAAAGRSRCCRDCC
jgi:tRNA1(Val) A37 N6-methylase TrmN6